MKNKISVVIPVYNGEKYIAETIQSLLDQTKKANEIIVVNDGSTDKTKDVLENFSKESNLIFHHFSENKGVAFTRNYGVSLSQGDWILFMDADDLAEPNLLEQYFNKLNESDSDDWVLIHSAYQQIDEKGSLLKGVHRFKQVHSQDILGYQLLRNHVYLSGTLVKKDSFIKSSGFNLSLTHSEDWDLWLRLAAIGGYGYVDIPLFKVRRHGNNTSANIKGMLEGERKVLEQYDVEYIKQAIYKRSLPANENKVDFVNILYRMGKWDDGINILKTIIDRDPRIMNKVWFLKGIYYYQIQEYSSARQSFTEALNYNAKDGASLNNLAVMHYLLNDSEKSVVILQKATELFPEFLDASYNLKEVKNQSGTNLKVTMRQLRPVLIRYAST